jgi:hypothetical protein
VGAGDDVVPDAGANAGANAGTDAGGGAGEGAGVGACGDAGVSVGAGGGVVKVKGEQQNNQQQHSSHSSYHPFLPSHSTTSFYWAFFTFLYLYASPSRFSFFHFVPYFFPKEGEKKHEIPILLRWFGGKEGREKT